MDTSKATPWRTDRNHIVNAKDQRVATVYAWNGRDTEEQTLIVKAVNAHDEAVRMLGAYEKACRAVFRNEDVAAAMRGTAESQAIAALLLGTDTFLASLKGE